MKSRTVVLLFVILPFLLLLHGALAHAPLEPSPDNESLESAYSISDPTKSWAIYTELHEGGEAQYYRLEMRQGERLRAMLYLPISEMNGFMPDLVVMGPGVTFQDTVPEYVEVPDGAGVMLLEAQHPAQPTYEPFTPSSYYYLADLDLDVSVAGTYYIVVYEPFRGGRFGLAIGYREEYGLDEWILVPIDVIGIHQWEGQSLVLILAPLIATVAVGLGLSLWRRPSLFQSIFNLTGVLAGLLYLGSGFMVLTQMIMALTTTVPDLLVVVTIVFTLLPILLALAMLRLTMGHRREVTNRVRVTLAVVGVLGLFTWAGLLVGPALSLIAGLLPAKRIAPGLKT